MDLPLAVAPVFKDGGTVIASLALAGAFFLTGSARARAMCVLVALLLSPVLLVGELWNTSQVHNLRDHPAELLALIVVGAGLMAGLAAIFLRRPVLLPILAIAALPFRVPVQAGGQSALLLVPLYVVVGGTRPGERPTATASRRPSATPATWSSRCCWRSGSTRSRPPTRATSRRP
jgi:putative inorganic carbon (hco3(-)) transporter